MAKYKDEDWLREQYIKKGKSQNEIARELDVNSGTINYWADKFDIESRDRVGEVRRKRGVDYANFYTNDKGHELWKASDARGGDDVMYVHRLLAIAEYGLNAVAENHVHHENGVPWDNRPDNIEPMNPEEHHRHHKQQFQDTWQNKDTPWRDEELLRELYVKRGIGTETLGERFGCAPTTVRRWLREYDIEVRDLSEAAYESNVWENAQ
jgi:transposase-like protein